VIQWFKEQEIPFTSKDIFSNKLTYSEVFEIIVKSENGTDDIISPRSKIVMENNIDFDSMKLSELINFILSNPSVLRRPIIVDDHRIQVGYNSEEIRTFIPRARRLAAIACSATDCPLYSSCGSKNEPISDQPVNQ